MSTLILPAREGGRQLLELKKIRKSIEQMAVIYRVLFSRSTLAEKAQVTLQDATFYRYGETFELFLRNNSHQVEVYEGEIHE